MLNSIGPHDNSVPNQGCSCGGLHLVAAYKLIYSPSSPRLWFQFVTRCGRLPILRYAVSWILSPTLAALSFVPAYTFPKSFIPPRSRVCAAQASGSCAIDALPLFLHDRQRLIVSFQPRNPEFSTAVSGHATDTAEWAERTL